MFETIKYISNHPITVCLDSEVKVPILLNKDGLVHPVNTSGKDIIVHQLNMTAEELKAYDKLVSETSSGSEVKALLEQKSEVINKRDANKPFLVKQLLNGEIKTEDVPKIKESREVSIQEEGQIEQKIKEHEEDEAKLANFFQNKTNFLYF